MSTILLADVKARLNKALNVDDDEIQDMIDAAEAEYVEWVGPITGSVTETVDGGRASIVLAYPNVSAITTAAYTDGTTIDTDDLVLDTRTGIVHWGYNTAGWFTWGTRNVELTYTVGALPANHREAIIADVAGYFATTQRGGTAAAFPGEDSFEQVASVTPLVLFPRIRALAVPSIA